MTRFKRYLILPLLIAIAACAATSVSKYPFPPQFVGPEVVPPRFLAVPAAPDSPKYTAEINGILAAQAKLTDEEKAQILAEDHIKPAMIVEPVLGNEFTEEKYPATFLLLKHAASDAWRDADNVQEYWNRQRPWVMDDRVELLVSRITRPSYPSGHSTTNHVWAHILGDLFPEKHDAFFARAYEIGMHRTLAGVHYPSDVEAGKKFAEQLYAHMQTNPAFKKEFEAAQAELLALKQPPAAIHILNTDGEMRTPKGALPTPPTAPAGMKLPAEAAPAAAVSQ